MKLLPAIAVGAVLAISGCAGPASSSAGGDPDPRLAVWPPDFSLMQVRSLTPNECKAILIARAALEAGDQAEIHAHFRVERQGQDWSVTAQYTCPPGYTSPPGNFTTVIIASDWSIRRIIGGA